MAILISSFYFDKEATFYCSKHFGAGFDLFGCLVAICDAPGEFCLQRAGVLGRKNIQLDITKCAFAIPSLIMKQNNTWTKIEMKKM